MDQEQIEAVRVRAIVVRNAAITFGGVEQIDLAKTVADDLDHLTTRLSEVERERDEAREMHRVWVEEPEGLRWYMDRASERAARITELEAEVARLRKINSDLVASFNAMNADQARIERDQARADLASLRAAVAEAVRRADERIAGDTGWALAMYLSQPLRNLTKPEAHGLRSDGEVCSSAWVKGAPCDCNLTKPETPSARIMSDKDRENPVEGAHPTQPEGEDALVEAYIEHADHQVTPEEAAVYVAALRKALASRGLVRGEGVEHG